VRKRDAPAQKLSQAPYLHEIEFDCQYKNIFCSKWQFPAVLELQRNSYKIGVKFMFAATSLKAVPCNFPVRREF
jgi:hypothetical protein